MSACHPARCLDHREGSSEHSTTAMWGSYNSGHGKGGEKRRVASLVFLLSLFYSRPLRRIIKIISFLVRWLLRPSVRPPIRSSVTRSFLTTSDFLINNRDSGRLGKIINNIFMGPTSKTSLPQLLMPVRSSLSPTVLSGNGVVRLENLL